MGKNSSILHHQRNNHLSGIFFTCLLAAGISFFAKNLPAQSDLTRPTNALTVADGLSQGMVFDICQTPDGFLWFATKDGLNDTKKID